MTKHRDFDYGERFHPSYTDALGELLGTYASANFAVQKNSATSLKVEAGTGNDQVGIAINGKWRWITSTLTKSMPGGGAGNFDVFVIAEDNDFVATGSDPPEDDQTVYSFDLKILASGGTPSGSGSEALYRKVAVVAWSGSAILTITPTIGFAAAASAAPANIDRTATTGVVGVSPKYAREDHTHAVSDGPYVIATGAGLPVSIPSDYPTVHRVSQNSPASVGMSASPPSLNSGGILISVPGVWLAIAHVAFANADLGFKYARLSFFTGAISAPNETFFAEEEWDQTLFVSLPERGHKMISGAYYIGAPATFFVTLGQLHDGAADTLTRCDLQLIKIA